MQPVRLVRLALRALLVRLAPLALPGQLASLALLDPLVLPALPVPLDQLAFPVLWGYRVRAGQRAQLGLPALLALLVRPA